jgi:hypothetical protein
MQITLTKTKELPDAEVSGNIPEGFTKDGELIAEPEVGRAFWLGGYWRTSPVTEIIDKDTFKTLNSIYKITRLIN